MSPQQFQISHELFLLKASSDETQEKLFVDIEVASRKNILTAKLLVRELLNHVDEEFLDTAVLEDIAKILRTQNKVESRRIAKGRAPQPGSDGKLVYLKRRLSYTHEREDREEPVVSLKDLYLFENIRAGEAVARLYPPKEGVAGKSVFGKEIPSSAGKPVQLKLDAKTLERESEKSSELGYERIVAKVDGYLEVQSSKLFMREEFLVKGNLDVQHGNLNFIGSVVVHGDVLPGFTIAAEKGITVAGNVNKAELYSLQGGVVVQGRFFGEKRGKIIAAGAVHLRSIQDGFVDSESDVFVQEEVRFSTIRTRATLQTGEATVLGGHCYAVGGADIGTFGSESETETELMLGSATEVSEKFQLLLKNIIDHEKGLGLIEAHLGPYAKNPARIALLASHLRPKMEALVEKQKKVSSSLQQLKDKKAELLSQEGERAPVPLSIRKSFYPKAVLIVGGQRFEPENQPLSGPLSLVFDEAQEEFVQQSYIAVPPQAEVEEKT
ncbi:FapA family protein [bacterium]|nr:FapA family protein [bacterium]